MRGLYALGADKLVGRQVRHIAVAGRAVGQLARVGLGVGHELLHAVGRHGGVDHQRQRHHRRQRHGRQVAQHVVLHALVQRRAERDGRGVVEQRMAVGRRLADQRAADVAVGAGLVVHHHRLAHLLRQLLRQQARHHVGGAAGREGHNHGDGLGRIGLRQRAGCGQCRQCAAGGQGQAGAAVDGVHVCLLGVVCYCVRPASSRVAV